MKLRMATLLLAVLIFCTILSSCDLSFSSQGSNASSSISQNEQNPSSPEDESNVTTSSNKQAQTSSQNSSKNQSSQKNNTSSEKNNSSKNTSSKKEQNSSSDIKIPPPANKTSSIASSSSKKETNSSSAPSRPALNVALKPITPDKYYGWQQLKAAGTQAEQTAYQLFVEAFGSYQRTVEFDFEITGDEVENAYNHYRDDYPQHFWLGSASYRTIDGKNINSFTVSNSFFGGDTEKIRQLEKEMYKKAEEILYKLDGSMAAVERERIIHDYLVNNIKYDTTLNAENAHDIYGALVNGVAVCEGYSKAFQYLMREAGVQCILVNGKFNGDSHEWNMVELDGKFYHVDVTADDPVSKNKNEQILKFDFFNLTQSAIEMDHTIDGNVYAIPAADSTKYNFFNYYGLKTKTLDKAAFAKSMIFSAKNGYNYAHIRLENIALSDALDYVINNYRDILDIANQNLSSNKLVMGTSISYSQNNSKNILSLKLDFE